MRRPLAQSGRSGRPKFVGALALLHVLGGAWQPLLAEAKGGGKSTTGGTSRSEAATVEQARKLYNEAHAEFAAGKYGEAAELFERAYKTYPKVDFLWNLAASLKEWFEVDRDSSHLRRARTIYENYASAASAQSDIAGAREKIAEIDAHLAKLEAPVPAPTPPAPTSLAATHPPSPTVPVGSAPTEAPATRPSTTRVTPSAATPPSPGTSPVTLENGATPVYKKWWLWTAVGGALVVGGGVAIGVLAATPTDAPIPGGLNAGVYPTKW